MTCRCISESFLPFLRAPIPIRKILRSLFLQVVSKRVSIYLKPRKYTATLQLQKHGPAQEKLNFRSDVLQHRRLKIHVDGLQNVAKTKFCRWYPANPDQVHSLPTVGLPAYSAEKWIWHLFLCTVCRSAQYNILFLNIFCWSSLQIR